MKKMISKLEMNKKLNHYCDNVLKLYNYGRISLPM